MKGLIVVTCGVLLIGASCSDDSISSSPVPLVEKSTIIQQGDAICAQAAVDEKQLVDQFKSTHANPSAAETLDFYTNELLPRYDRAVGDMHRIGEPTKDRADFDAAINALDEGLTKFKEEIAQDPVKVLQSGSTAFDHSDKLFVDYGFKECGKAASGHDSSGSSSSTTATSSSST